MPSNAWDVETDILVVGSGKGAMTAAVSAYEMGCRDILLVEKAERFGGTSALSGGVIWIPCNRYARALGQQDSLEEAHDYLRRTIPEGIRRDAMIEAYLENGPRMVDFLHERTHARYRSLSMYPDYHSHVQGAKLGNRALEPEPFDSALLGSDNDLVSHSHRLWYLGGVIPLTLTELNAIQVRLPGWWRMLASMLLRYALDVPWRLRSRYDRYRKIGGSGVARLYLSLKERGVPMRNNTALIDLIESDGRVIGAVVERQSRRMRIHARKAVVLCAGGFEQNQQMRERYLPAPTSREWSTGVTTNTGDAINAGVRLGALTALMESAWWCMTTRVPGESAPRLMIIEKALPGCCLVGPSGQRFLNESQNYQSLVGKLYEAHAQTDPVVPTWLVFDARFRRDYIIGPLLTPAFKPDWTFPKRWFEEGFIAKAQTIDALAKRIAVDAAGLMATIAKMNAYAKSGRDVDFQRGDSPYDRHYGDPKIQPNPNLAPIDEAPFYAMRLDPGDIGTQGGLVTNTHGQVLHSSGQPIPGLYASGNCTAAVLPTYPGPGATLGPAMVFAYQAAKHITGFRD
ncbi:MAG: FAD-binding protein [Steroidobacteraceae bacterium]